jgi:type I restriction-modification system DNA methylase subunit
MDLLAFSSDLCQSAIRGLRQRRTGEPLPTLYSDLDPRTQLEQQVAHDLKAALEKRGATVTHHGTGSSHAPSIAVADISVEWTVGGCAHHLLVEVAKRSDESEFTSIVEHLNRAVALNPSAELNVLYSGLSTSVRMARFIRNENQQRKNEGCRGRIVFLPLNRLQTYLEHWVSAPAAAFPLTGISTAISRWAEFATDLAAAQVIQAEIFPDWSEKHQELDVAQQQELAIRQERLRKDIVTLENKLRERGVTGQRSHKFLIYLFFVALYEDKRGPLSRATLSGFAAYKASVSPKDKDDPEFRDKTVHHLVVNHIKFDKDIQPSGMLDQYERVDLSDDFIVSSVLPIFERYPLSAGGIDFIGAVFEALARRAEKDNRIGQFFTPETAVIATVRLAAPRPTDTVLDPACGTGRFLIHAMDAMLAGATATPSQGKAEVERDIRRERLLGTDIDPWVATIAKMNMYLHGDGKSNIRAANGLALSASNVFAPRTPARAHEAIDVALTNPPLGDVNFREIASELARTGSLGPVKASPGSAAYAAEITTKANAWTKSNLSVVPHRCIEFDTEKALQVRVEGWRNKVLKAMQAGDEKEERKARRFLAPAEAQLADIRAAISSGKLTHVPAGNNAKGGALFLSAILDYLKPVRDPGAPEEWKGGSVGIVVDEAVLNTPAYSDARKFIRQYYYIKAVVSLPRNAFEFLAKTTAKTSILLLTRKPDSAVIQREPVFFARADTIGYTSVGVDSTNDLPMIVELFEEWRRTAPTAYGGVMLDETLLQKALSSLSHSDRTAMYRLNTGDTGERLDYAYHRMRELIAGMTKQLPLSDILEPIVRIPDTALVDQDAFVHTYAWVRGTDGRVCVKGPQDLKYDAKELRQLKEGDILVSGIDAVKGAIGVVGADSDGLVVSKEFFTLRVKDTLSGQVEPEYVVRLLRSSKMRAIIEGAITGVSNRTRIESAVELLRLPIPPLPSLDVQQDIAKRVADAFVAQDAASNTFSAIDEELPV